MPRLDSAMVPSSAFQLLAGERGRFVVFRTAFLRIEGSDCQWLVSRVNCGHSMIDLNN
jgi:hypothetical protein